MFSFELRKVRQCYSQHEFQVLRSIDVLERVAEESGHVANLRPPSALVKLSTNYNRHSVFSEDSEYSNSQLPSTVLPLTQPSENPFNGIGSQVHSNRLVGPLGSNQQSPPAFSHQSVAVVNAAANAYCMLGDLSDFVALNRNGFNRILKRYLHVACTDHIWHSCVKELNSMHPFEPQASAGIANQFVRIEQIYARSMTCGDLGLAREQLRFRLRQHATFGATKVGHSEVPCRKCIDLPSCTEQELKIPCAIKIKLPGHEMESFRLTSVRCSSYSTLR